jgi:hypothetical protein
LYLITPGSAVKPLTHLGMNSQSHSKSHLKMTK